LYFFIFSSLFFTNPSKWCIIHFRLYFGRNCYEHIGAGDRMYWYGIVFYFVPTKEKEEHYAFPDIRHHDVHYTLFYA
jgi:hypothetical protein